MKISRSVTITLQNIFAIFGILNTTKPGLAAAILAHCRLIVENLKVGKLNNKTVNALLTVDSELSLKESEYSRSAVFSTTNSNKSYSVKITL